MVSIVGIIAVGIAAVFSFFFFRRAGEVGLGPAGSEIGSALGSIGTGIGQTGSGIALFGQGIGSGITGLFSPLKFFQELLFGNTPIVNNVNPNTVQSSSAGGQTVGSSSTSVSKIGGSSLITGFLAGPGGL